MEPPEPRGRLLTVREVAKALRVREETVRRWLRQGRLHGANLGQTTGWRVPYSEVERLLREGGLED
jgi:excisionase family DNA binding protein